MSTFLSIEDLMKREDTHKVRERALQNLKLKGAFSAQELYDGHLSKSTTRCDRLLVGWSCLVFHLSPQLTTTLILPL